MSIATIFSLKQSENISINSESDLNKLTLASNQETIQSSDSTEGIFSSEEVQIDEKFCSSEDLNPDQNDDHNEDDCTEDEEEFEQKKEDMTKEGVSKECCRHSSEVSSSAPASQEVLDNQSTFPLDEILPCTIGNLRIKKIVWDDFAGTPNYDLKWSAHAFWGINYTYTVHQKTAKNKKVSYTIKPEVNVWLKRKSWAKRHNPHLLNHEQGHYILGCFCGLEFKKQIMQYQFTDNYRFEIPRLFEKILKEHTVMEKRYDKETNHRMNREKQTEWDNNMLSKMKEYQRFFQQFEATPKNTTKNKKRTL